MDTLNGNLLRQMLFAGYDNVCDKEKKLNKMNVFPVPDGDTGTNIKITLKNALDGLENKNSGAGDFFNELSERMVLGARGNSGTILSGFYSGIAASVRGKAVLSVNDLSEALVSGYDSAYSAIEDPVEGTILTILKDASSYVESHSDEISDIEAFFDMYLGVLNDSYNRTDELLFVLKKAGVKDSGAYGYIQIVSGEIDCLKTYLHGKKENSERIDNGNGMSLPKSFSENGLYSDNFKRDSGNGGPGEKEKKSALDYSRFDENSHFEWGYCVEFLLRLMNAKQDVSLFDKNAYLAELKKSGSSVVCIQSGSIVKVHVHTFEPDKVIALSLRYGEFLSFKLENMCLQHNEMSDELYEMSDTVLPAAEEEEKEEKETRGNEEDLGIIVLSPDRGFSDLLSSFPGTHVVSSSGGEIASDAKECVALCKKIKTGKIAVLVSDSELYERLKKETLPDNAALIRCNGITDVYFALAMDAETDADKRIESFSEIIKKSSSFCVKNSLPAVGDVLKREAKRLEEGAVATVFVPKESSESYERFLSESFPGFEVYCNPILTNGDKVFIGII